MDRGEAGDQRCQFSFEFVRRHRQGGRRRPLRDFDSARGSNNRVSRGFERRSAKAGMDNARQAEGLRRKLRGQGFEGFTDLLRMSLGNPPVGAGLRLFEDLLQRPGGWTSIQPERSEFPPLWHEQKRRR